MKIRKQTYSLDQYLMLMKDETIRSDQDCQRLSGQWNCNMVNELIFTVLTDNYIPPIILGEEIQMGSQRNISLTDYSAAVHFSCSAMEIPGSPRVWMNIW